MNREIAMAWVADLRSGEFVQGRGRLCKKEHDPETGQFTGRLTYCCLGVLTLRAIEAGAADPEAIERGLLPEEVINWAGIASRYDRHDPVVKITYNRQRNLSELNDRSHTFEQIAALIEEQWEDL